MFMSRRKMYIALTILTLTAGATSASAEQYPKEMEESLIKVCKAIKSDSRFKLKSAVKATGLKMRDLYKGLVCNGEDMLTFAATHNAKKTGVFIAKRVNAEPTMLTAKR